MNHPHSKALLLTVGAIATGASGLSCFGAGSADYANIEGALKGSCVPCHDPSQIDKVIAEVTALDDATFTEATLPETWFRQKTRAVTVEEIITLASPPADASIDPKSPLRKAWLLHDLNTMQKFLHDTPPPDYRSQATFDAFILTGKTPATLEGCEIDDLLRKGAQASAEGMPPRWSKTLLDQLHVPFTAPNALDRQNLTDYLNGMLPGGVITCDWVPQL